MVEINQKIERKALNLQLVLSENQKVDSNWFECHLKLLTIDNFRSYLSASSENASSNYKALNFSGFQSRSFSISTKTFELQAAAGI